MCEFVDISINVFYIIVVRFETLKNVKLYFIFFCNKLYELNKNN